MLRFFIHSSRSDLFPRFHKVFSQLRATALQRQNTEISKQIFPEKEYRGLSPNFHIHVSVIDLYIPTIGAYICWRKYVDRSWDYINRSQTHECGTEKEYISGIFVAVRYRRLTNSFKHLY
jgi:hypothetical protein